MSTDRDTTRIVRSWIRTDEHASADRILDDVLAALDTTPQRRSAWPAWRTPTMNNTVRLIAAAAAVVVVAIIGYQFLIAPNVSGPGPLPTDSPAAPTLTPGVHVVTDVVPFQLSIDLPEGWIPYPENRLGSTGWFAFKPGASDTDGCCWIGFTTVDLHPCVAAFDAAAINIDGFAGSRIEIPSAVGCHPNGVLDSLGVPGGRGLNNLLTFYVLDVGGEELVLFAWTNPPDVAQQEFAEQLIESAQIERR